jgi:hypothetical protein
VIDSPEVFVTSRHSSETIDSTSANTACLTFSSSKTASITRSQSAYTDLSELAETSARSRAALSFDARPFASSLSISARTYARPRCARSSSRSVITTGTSSRRANMSAICPAMSPAPTTPTLPISFARPGLGAPSGRLPRDRTRLNA